MQAPGVRFVAALIPVLTLAGCSADPYPGRFGISGKVTLEERPLKTAIVTFEPLEGQDTAGNATITNGVFSIPRQNGLKVGKYRVQITAGDGKTAVNPVNPDEPPGPGGGTNIVSRDLVPPSWNRKSKQEVTVTTEGPNSFQFDIK
jgi:hypothetical protein